MALSNDLVSQFVKITKDETPTAKESVVYGTVVYNGRTYVKLDGSDLLTPVVTTSDAKDGERVTVLIKDHTAIITGNLTSPSARTDDVKEVSKHISEFEIVITDEIAAERGRINELAADNVRITETLTAVNADIDNLQADSLTVNEKLTAQEADITKLNTEKLSAEFAELTYATIDNLEALNAEFHTLESTYGTFEELTAQNFEAVNASIKTLEVDKLSAEQADLTYVNIDFSNIDKAWMEEFYAKSGLIEYVTAGDATVTGHLVGVTISGDLIEGNTIKADKLIVKGSDGLYYKMNIEGGVTSSEEVTEEDLQNGLHGRVIIAKSITAEQISVKDLVAFGATIGGFSISDSSIYSGVKASVDNTTRGIYFDAEGQLSIGDGTSFLKYYRDGEAVAEIVDGVFVVNNKDSDVFSASISNGVLNIVGGETDIQFANGVLQTENPYRLAISADSIMFGSDSRSSAADLKALTEHVKIGTIIDEETGDEKPCVELAEGDSDFKQVITNIKTIFMDGQTPKTIIDTNGIETGDVKVNGEFHQNGFMWATRANGNYGLSWKGVTS